MPRLSAIRERVVEHVAGQLRFAPPEALLRAVERVEELAGEVERGAEYPADWVVFRVTGFRSDRAAEQMPAVRGTALLADLSALAERLSQGAGVAVEAARGAGMLGVADVCRRWNVSRKSVDRMRREGLIARRVVDGRGRASLVFAPAVVERFESRWGARLARARAFSRIGPDDEERMVRLAVRCRRTLGWSVSTTAARLAERFGRSHEAVRALLLRQGRLLRDGAPSVRVTRRAGRGVLEALGRGEEPRDIASRLGGTARGVLRAAALERRARLTRLADGGALAASASPTFEHPDAAEVILSPRAVVEGLGGAGITDLHAFLRAAREGEPGPARDEAARALAYHYLRWRCAGAIAALDTQHPGMTALDEIETRLRWAARLKAELVRGQLPLAVETLEGLLGAAPEDLPRGMTSAQAGAVVREAIGALGEAVERFEPQRPVRLATGRLAAAAGLAVTRTCTRWLRERGLEGAGGAWRAGRAGGRLLEGVAIADWTRTVAPWQRWLEPEAGVREAIATLTPAARELLAERFGWTGGPPRTLADAARARGVTVMRAAVLERRALREVRRLMEIRAET